MRLTEAILGGRKRNTHYGGRQTRNKFEIRADEDVKNLDLMTLLLGEDYWDLKARTLRHAGLKMKDAILSALRATFPRAFTEENINKKNYSDTMSKGVMVRKVTGGANHMSIRVDILGIRAKSSGTYRLRFFEEGAFRSPKRNKDGKERGDLPHFRFFKTGVASINFVEIVK
jgi:hypothetical protein